MGSGSTPRGFPCTNPSDPLNCVHFMSTPNVLQAGRDYFDCQSLPGVELENQDTSCALLASHWEERLLQNEIMQPVTVGGEVHISPMTLAVFEDSGWYTADYSKASRSTPGALRLLTV